MRGDQLDVPSTSEADLHGAASRTTPEREQFRIRDHANVKSDWLRTTSNRSPANAWSRDVFKAMNLHALAALEGDNSGARQQLSVNPSGICPAMRN